MDLDITEDYIQLNEIRTIYPRADAKVKVWVDAGLLLGYEKRKGRDWLADSGGYNSRQPQAKATLDKAIVYSTDDLRNPAFSRKSQTDAPAFKKWFGDSKVVDENGKPLVVYHGTKSDVDFSVFNTPSHFGSADQASLIAGGLKFGAPLAAQGESDRVMPVYLSIQDPAYIYDSGAQHTPSDYLEAAFEKGYLEFSEMEAIKYDDPDGDSDVSEPAHIMEKLIDRLEMRGYDGFAYYNQVEGEGASWMPFRPEQIKSASGNSGAYDGSDPTSCFPAPPRQPLLILLILLMVHSATAWTRSWTRSSTIFRTASSR